MRILLSMLFLMFGQNLWGSDLWNFSPGDAPHHKSIVRIDNMGKGCGTGVVVKTNDTGLEDKWWHRAWVMTALHVVSQPNPNNVLGLPKTIAHKVKVGSIVDNKLYLTKDSKVVVWDEDNDIAIIKTTVSKKIKAVDIAERNSCHRDKLEFCGLGGLSCKQESLKKIRHFYGEVAQPTCADTTYANVVFRSGDSGGPAFKDGKLTGIISGGWFWFKEGEETNLTWPGKFCNTKPLKDLLLKISDS